MPGICIQKHRWHRSGSVMPWRISEARMQNAASSKIKENLVRYNKRLVYIKCVTYLIGAKENRKVYAYLCRDLSIKHELEKHLIERAQDQRLSGEEIFDTMQEQGIFVLVSSRRISKENLLPLFYTRDQIEKIFELCKQYGKILPLNVETEATFRGHLMMTFMAAVILKLMSEKLKKQEGLNNVEPQIIGN